MSDTPGRLLAMLSLMQSQPEWTGTELARRLKVSTRTVRNDIDRLRNLGYPVDGTRGRTGHYRLGSGAKLPPLLLDDQEAVSVAVGLRAVTGLTDSDNSTASAIRKLDQVLPRRLRSKVAAIHSATSHGPDNTSSNVEDPEVDSATLTAIAVAVKDGHVLRFDYSPPDKTDVVAVEPYRLVNWQRRWYLVARDDLPGHDWGIYRVDWIRPHPPTFRRFTPRPLSDGDYPGLVLREVAATGWKVHARITVLAPADEVVARINAAVGVVEPIDETTSTLVTGGDSVEIIAVYIGMLGMDFRVSEPPELVEHVRILGHRYAAAVEQRTPTRHAAR